VNERFVRTNAAIAENKYQNFNLKEPYENQTIHPSLHCGQLGGGCNDLSNSTGLS
jgi:hypothetical protein